MVDVQDAARRALDRNGETLTHVSFTSSSTDAYGDEEWTRSTQEVTGRVSQGRNPYQTRDASETEANQKALIYVSDELDLTDEHDDGRPDEFELDDDGDGTADYVWKISLAMYDGNGLYKCECRLVS